MMGKILRWIFSILALALVVQFFRPARTNPPIDEAQTLQAQSPVPPDVSAIITRACYDCHSHQTKWPWYSNVQPVAWFLVDHVNEGRRHLNFSEWGTYSPKRRHHKLEEISDEVQGGAMPLESYLPLHAEARLTPADIAAIAAWAAAERERLAATNNLAAEQR